jgi:lipoprotein NlpI
MMNDNQLLDLEEEVLKLRDFAAELTKMADSLVEKVGNLTSEKSEIELSNAIENFKYAIGFCNANQRIFSFAPVHKFNMKKFKAAANDILDQYNKDPKNPYKALVESSELGSTELCIRITWVKKEEDSKDERLVISDEW